MISNGRAHRMVALCRGGVAALLIVVLIVGVPWGLVTAVGWPLPHHVPTPDGLRSALETRGIPNQTLLDALGCVAWLAWASVAISLAEEMAATTFGRGSKRLPIVGAFQPVAARLVAAVFLALFAFIRPDVPSKPTPRISLAQQIHPNVVLTADVSVSAAPKPPVQAPAPAPVPVPVPNVQPTSPAVETPLRTYTVVPNDNLWSIADSQLGDGADWPAIAALNLGRTMSDGRRFVDPNLIYPGWILLMPESSPSVAPIADTSPSGFPPPTIAPTPPTKTPLPHVTKTHRAVRFSAKSVPSPVGRAARSSIDPLPHSVAIRSNTSKLPELAALGIGAVGCAALARRSRRIRLLRRASNHQEGHASAPSSLAVDTDTLLSRFDGIPALQAFELANGLLGHELSLQDPPNLAPRFRAISIGASGVDFWLRTSGQAPPRSFTLSDRGESWHIGHDLIDQADNYRPFLPIVLPVGEDDVGTWLVPLQPGHSLPVLGEAADDLCRAARSVQEAWSWADLVLVSDDPLVVQNEAQFLPDDIAPMSDNLQILFYGDPNLLSENHRKKVAVVTTCSGDASDVTVLVDHNAATIHPLGRTVRPHLLGPRTAGAVEEILSTQESPDDGTVPPSEPIPKSDVEPGLYVRGPGTVEVRLLTMTPRLEGLRDDLPPNRARRATELVAYLALHHPDVVTSDRLRTRVLGSSDADAASKTLFNTASAARRSLGMDATGAPLLPSGSRTGHYQISEAVSTDVGRAADLASMGDSAKDPDEAMALLRASLELIEGEPLANALSGYTWWEAEGHGARAAGVAVNAACNLAALAVDEELFDLAHWGLEKARLVDPYSEALSRTAMQAAAAAGDTDRLRREWRECQRRVDELDPGGFPSPRTERLYGELSQRVLSQVSNGHDG
jgi:DNA-binding SARP family transcriptional activator